MKGCTCLQMPPGQWCPMCLPYAQRAGLALPSQAPQEAQKGAPTAKTVRQSRAGAERLLEAARGLPDGPRYRSKTEARFAREIAEPWLRDGRIVRWYFEPMQGLWLTPELSYTCDFLFELPDARLWFVEVSGPFKWRKDEYKVKFAATRYPAFRFWRATWRAGQWHWKAVPAAWPRQQGG